MYKFNFGFAVGERYFCKHTGYYKREGNIFFCRIKAELFAFAVNFKSRYS